MIERRSLSDGLNNDTTLPMTLYMNKSLLEQKWISAAHYKKNNTR